MNSKSEPGQTLTPANNAGRALPTKPKSTGFKLKLSSIIIGVLILFGFSAVAYGVSPLLVRLFQIEPAINSVFEQGLGKDLNLSQSSGKYTVTLEKGYADANRIALAFSIKGVSKDESVMLLSSKLSDEQNNTFPVMSSIFNTNLNTDKEGFVTLLFFERGAALQNSASELKLHLALTPQVNDKLHKEIPAYLSPVEFNFTLPSAAGKTLELNQTIQDKGISITLEKVVISPSAVYAYLSARRPDNKDVHSGSWSLIAGLNANGQAPKGMISSQFDESLDRLTSPTLRWTYQFHDAFADKVGEWQLNVTEVVGHPTNFSCTDGQICKGEGSSSQVRIQGNWNFKFNYQK